MENKMHLNIINSDIVYRKERLRSYKYVKMRCINFSIWTCERLVMDGFWRSRGRPIKYRRKVIK